MPELPEVETVRIGLEKKITGLTIQEAEILTPRTFQGKPEDIRGKKVLKVWRRAKILGINLTDKVTLLFHLKMTGQLIFIARESRFIGGHPTRDMAGDLPNKSTRVIFEFSDGSHLYFNDQRKFGWIKIIGSDQMKEVEEKVLGRLGPEPFDKDFTWDKLKTNLLRRKKTPIKVAILDQAVVAGVGNIYASESLYLARIDPRRRAEDLSDKEIKRLYESIKQSLEIAIKHGGSTIAHFVSVEGEKGYFLDYAKVYGKEGQPCPGCQGKIQKIQQGGRGTYFCPECQK